MRLKMYYPNTFHSTKRDQLSTQDEKLNPYKVLIMTRNLLSSD